VDNGANLLVAVPGGGDGPGGVLVCSENFIIYKNQDHEDVRAVIPRRSDLLADRGVLIVCYATHKKKAYSFFLVQVILNQTFQVCAQFASKYFMHASKCSCSLLSMCTYFNFQLS
jgi:splicing factor 3B subunit 3